jgi:anti-anti-sigma factor
LRCRRYTTGELDIATAPRAWEVLVQAFERDSRIAIDLSGVTFIDSQGLKLFVRAFFPGR